MSDIDRLHDIREDVDRATQLFEGAARSTSGSSDGADDTGSVTVRLGPDGLLRDVRVSPGWHGRVGSPAGLADAVLAAVRTASLARMEEWGRGLGEALDGPAPRVRPAPPAYDTLAARLEGHVRAAKSPQEVAAVEAALVDVMDELLSSIDEASAQVDAALATTVRGDSGRGRHVTAELAVTGEITALEYDPAWLERAHPANIGRETMAAVDSARAQLACRSVSDVLAASRLRQLQSMLEDPTAVTARLGL